MRSIYLFSVFFVLSMVGYSQESLQLFYQNKKAGYKNQAGQVIVPPKYDAGSQFVNGFAVVMLAVGITVGVAVGMGTAGTGEALEGFTVGALEGFTVGELVGFAVVGVAGTRDL